MNMAWAIWQQFNFLMRLTVQGAVRSAVENMQEVTDFLRWLCRGWIARGTCKNGTGDYFTLEKTRIYLLEQTYLEAKPV